MTSKELKNFIYYLWELDEKTKVSEVNKALQKTICELYKECEKLKVKEMEEQDKKNEQLQEDIDDQFIDSAIKAFW